MSCPGPQFYHSNLRQSDHPVLNSRYLLYEAQQAYYYGFPENLALASVTSNSAEVMGMGHRIGYVREGAIILLLHTPCHSDKSYQSRVGRWCVDPLIDYNVVHLQSYLDLVIWDSHPLALGATPSQVFIDGIPQLKDPYVVQKPSSFQNLPKVPNFDKEAAAAIEYEGLPPIAPKHSAAETTMFLNVKSIYTAVSGTIQATFSTEDKSTLGVAVTRNGTLICSGIRDTCLTALENSDVHFVDLDGGSIAPALVSFGSPLGLQHIDQEASTNDGDVYDPIIKAVPNILGGDASIIRAVDGLLYGTRDAL